MLIEMITPKVSEIEEKFGKVMMQVPLIQGDDASPPDKGDLGGCQDDINTLLLKSQYNHINHLDLKGNEVVADVAGLEGKFDNKFNDLKGEFNGLKGDFELLKQSIETTIQKTLNKNMMALIVVMGAFLTLSKVIDKF